MESNLTFFSLPFVDAETSDLAFKNKGQDFDSDISNQLQLQGLSSDDVLAHFLTADGPLEEPDLNGPTILHCEICAKQFDNAKKYYGHLRVHSKDNLWKCDKCPNQRFSTKQQLMKHSLVHKPLARVWKCPQCSLVFEALWRLQQHLFAKHLNYRPHKCEQCQKTFQKPSDLKKHLDTHSETRKHACPTCNVKFKDKSNLKRHIASHNSEKPFYCIGCGRKFKQVGSLNRHIKKCAFRGFVDESHLEKNAVKHYCNICGLAFQVKMNLIEHYVKQHTNSIETSKEQKQNQLNIDANKTVDNIVDDILSVEDEYMTMSTQKENLNTFNTTANQQDANYDNLMQIEFFKDMNLYSLDDELLYNDIDLDTFQNSHMFNMNSNDIDYCINDRNTEIQLDLIDVGKSMEQDIMSSLCPDKEDTLPDELLNVAEMTNFNKPSDPPDPLFSVNECATIFESDVDLEASTNLAANLNQLIGENSVQYISTEDDDTFIISLRSEIDAEQLTDMLNIDVGVDDTSKTIAEKPPKEINNPGLPNNIIPIIVEIKDSIKPPNHIENAPTINKEEEKKENGNKEKRKKKPKKRVLFVCRTCCKVFNKKDNYRSHLGTHEPNLRRHGCKQCGLRFGYRSTLNKHIASKHSPDAAPAPTHACEQCPKRYKAAWMLRNHVEREHERRAPHACARAGCAMRFYKRSDLAVHQRSHTRERPYACDVCSKSYSYNSNLKRHQLTHATS